MNKLKKLSILYTIFCVILFSSFHSYAENTSAVSLHPGDYENKKDYFGSIIAAEQKGLITAEEKAKSLDYYKTTFHEITSDYVKAFSERGKRSTYYWVFNFAYGVALYVYDSGTVDSYHYGSISISDDYQIVVEWEETSFSHMGTRCYWYLIENGKGVLRKGEIGSLTKGDIIGEEIDIAAAPSEGYFGKYDVTKIVGNDRKEVD